MIRTPLLAAAVPITVALAPVQPNNNFGPVSPRVLSLVPGVLIFSILVSVGC